MIYNKLKQIMTYPNVNALDKNKVQFNRSNEKRWKYQRQTRVY